MKKVDMIKAAGSIIISVGVGAIVGNVIKCTTPPSVGTIKRVCIGVGGFVLSSMIGDKTTEYAEKKVDDAVNSIKNMVKEEEI